MNYNYSNMQEFLNMIGNFAIYNPGMEISSKFVYSQLKNFNLSQENINQNVEYYFPRWMNEYQNNNNIKVINPEHRKYFLWFLNGKIKGNEIKLYIPLDIYHIYGGAKVLFDFISNTNIEHESKIASEIRNDNIVVRVNSLEDAQTIINFVQGNNYLKEGLMRPNPFIPNLGGIGITMDNNYSYNTTVSNMISEFVTQIRYQNRYDLLTPENLGAYVNSKIATTQDEDLKDIYKLISQVTSKNFTIQDFVNHANSKLMDGYDSNRRRITNPEYYFEKAVVATYNKFPQEIKTRISKYLSSGDSKLFTNMNKARMGLEKYVHQRDVISIMRSKFLQNGFSFPNSDSELIDGYLNMVTNGQYSNNYTNTNTNIPKSLNNENEVNYNMNNQNEVRKDINIQSFEIRNLRVNEKYDILKNAYINTALTSGYEYADVAIRELIENSNVQYFSGYETQQLLSSFALGVEGRKVLSFFANTDRIDTEALLNDLKSNIQNESMTQNMTR